MIIIIGDVIVDEYIKGVVERISPEAPVPILDWHDRSVRPGGALNVTANIRTLGEQALCIGVIGNDGVFPIREDHADFLITDYGRPTTLKTRIVSQGQQLMRIDRESRLEISPRIEESVLDAFHVTMDDNKDKVSMVVISDYAKGVVTREVARRVILGAKARHIPVIVDSKRSEWFNFAGASLITPNSKELNEACGEMDLDVTQIVSELDCPILETCGERGMVIHRRDGNKEKILAKAREVVDVTGAGDTVVAALAVYGIKNLRAAADFANRAAAIVVAKHGTATVTREEMGERV